ncbi:MAG: HAD hydrolase-like protein [Culturomica sp.]|jgi:nucleoside phosphorylase/phosphoserine phosphatase|nr:HAD hydrolase-like protein [Culturomica sp.]
MSKKIKKTPKSNSEQRNVKITNLSFAEIKKMGIIPKIALITANDVERDAVLEEMTTAIYKVIINTQTYYIGTFGQFTTVLVRLGSMGTVDTGAATLTVNELINLWKVDCVIAVGIAMGMKEDVQKFGDVLISKTILNYDVIKRTERGDIDRSTRPNASQSLFDRFVNCPEWQFYRDDNSVCKIHSGLLLTGASLVNQTKFVNKLKEKYPDAIGNEMEAGGVWSACEKAKKEWIIVKGICDFGIDKTDDFQKLAADAAVSLCKEVLNNPDALDGITKKNLKNGMPKNSRKNEIATKRINSLKLYYYRKNEKKLTTFQLSQQTEISERQIIELEAFKTEQPFSKLSFPTCTNKELRTLEKILCDGRRILEVKDNPTDFMGYYLSYYYKFKLGRKEGFNNFKAIVFDFDGTLTDNQHTKARSTWQKMWQKLGYTLNDCNELHQKFSNNEISHSKWCKITCKKFIEKEMGINVLREIASEMILINGCFPTLRKLKNSGIHLYITSGSIKDVIEAVIGNENIEIFEEIRSNKMAFNENGKLTKIIGTKFDFKGKADFIEMIVKKLNINPYEVLFIGNSNNDELAYQSGAITLCVNPHNTSSFENKKWNNTIYDMQNLEEILQFVNIK